MLDWFTEPFASGLTQNALAEMALLSVLSGVVGVYIVLRGLAFIVDGISHAILPGIAVALLVGGNLLIGSVVAALIVTSLISFTSRNRRVSEDSAIGIFFTGAFALGVILVSSVLTGKSKKGSTPDILFGQLFGVSEQDLLITLFLGTGLVLLFLALRKELLVASFDPNLAKAMGFSGIWLDLILYLGIALSIVVALPAVGNILALAFLITPAATARLLTNRFYPLIILSFVIGLFSSLVGIYLSYYLRLAGGASIVLVLGLLYGLVMLCSPHYGLVSWFIRQRAIRTGQVSWQEQIERANF